MNSLLLETTVQNDFLTSVLPILRYIIFGAVIVCSIIIIIAVLLQSNSSDGSLDVFTNTKQESYYSKNKGATRDGILKKITIAMAIVIFVLAVLYFITELINRV